MIEIINTENTNEARKLIEQLSKHSKQVIILGKSIDFNRVILENKKVNMLVLDHTNKKDRLKQQDSGLNHVLCHLARDNNIILAFDMNELQIESKKEQALVLARWMQNLTLIKKAKCKIKLLNYKEKLQAFSFLLTLGLSTNLATMAIS